jgi:hypothetical protein
MRKSSLYGDHHRWATISREAFSLMDTTDVKALAHTPLPLRLISWFRQIDPN